MNLLSPQQKKVIQKEILLKFFLAILGVFSLLAIILLILIYNISFYLGIQTPAINERIRYESYSVSSKAYQDVEERINDLNAGLVLVDKIRGKGFGNIGGMLRKASSLVPAGVYLTSLSYQGDTLGINGHADTREQTINFKNALEKDSLCVSLVSPVPVKETNLDFTFVCNLEARSAAQQNSSPVPVDEEEL